MTVFRVINHPEQVTDELKEQFSPQWLELDFTAQILLQKALVTNRSASSELFILGRNRHNRAPTT